MNYSAYATKASSTEINRRVYVCGSYARAKIDQPNEDRCHWRKVNGLLTKAPIVKEQDLVAPINQALMSAYELIADSLVTPIPDPDPTCIPLRAEIKDLYKLIAKYGDAGGELQSRIDRLNVEINNITLGPTPDPLREEFIAIFRSGLVLATMTPHEAAAVYRRYLDRVTIVDRKIAEIKLKVR
jgi:hypothetical protein